MGHDPIDTDMYPVDIDDDDSSSSDIGIASPPQKRACLRAVVSHVRPGERVHPDSAYVGTEAHNRALTAKPESEVLKQFLVCFWFVRANLTLGG